MERYRIKIVPEADYKPTDGEPFALAWGKEGWTVGCRTPIQPRSKPVKKVAKEPGGKTCQPQHRE